MHSYEVFRHYERNHWRLAEIPFDTIDAEKVRPEYVTLAKSAVMGESNSIAAQHGFYNEFGRLRLLRVRRDLGIRGDPAPLGVPVVARGQRDPWRRAGEAQREPYPPGSTPSATLATNVISELTVNHIYKAVAAWMDEPVIAGIMRRASLDEAGHAREFIHYARRRLAAHPSELPSVLETLYVYTSEDRIKHPVRGVQGRTRGGGGPGDHRHGLRDVHREGRGHRRA